MNCSGKSHSLVWCLLLVLPFVIAEPSKLERGADISELFLNFGNGESKGADAFLQGSSKERLSAVAQDSEFLNLYPCNEYISSMTQDDVGEMLPEFLEDTFGPDFAATTMNLFEGKLNYGFGVFKACMSCKLVREHSKFQDLSEKDSFLKYCGEDVYGSDIEHSGLIVVPFNGEGYIVPGSLSGYIHSRPTQISSLQAPSQFTNSGGIDFLVAIMATVSNGVASIVPDFMGYGSSTAFRSYLVRDAYVSATLPLWLAAELLLDANTFGCTSLRRSALYSGYSEGGYASLAIADGMKAAIDLEPVIVVAGGSPFGVKDSLLFDARQSEIELAAQEKFSPYAYIILLLGVSYSSTTPTVANYESGHDLLLPEVRKRTLEYLADPFKFQDDYNALLRQFGSDSRFAFNEAIFSLVDGAVEAGNRAYCDPNYAGYDEDRHGKFCEALIQNDLTETLLGVDYAVGVLHSPDDELVSIANVPDVSANPYLQFQELSGSHYNAGIQFVFFAFSYMTQILTTATLIPNIIDLPPRCENSDSNSLFLYRKRGKIIKTCSFVASLSIEKQEKICTKKKFQIRLKSLIIPPASVSCHVVCAPYTVEERGTNRFIYRIKNQNGKDVSKSCNWLLKKKPVKIKEICGSFVEFGSGLYGQAADVCTDTCKF